MGGARYQHVRRIAAGSAYQCGRVGHPDVLILSDINMPGISGLELLKQIKLLYPRMRVVMITAYGDAESYQQAMGSGADGFLTKPVDFKELKKMICNT